MKQLLFGLLFLLTFQLAAQTTHSISVIVDQPANCQTLSIEDIQFQGFSIYPNPAQNQFTIESKSLEEIKEVIIYNMIGQEVKKNQYSIKATKTTLNTSRLKKGLYFIQVKTSTNRYNYNIVINN